MSNEERRPVGKRIEWDIAKKKKKRQTPSPLCCRTFGISEQATSEEGRGESMKTALRILEVLHRRELTALPVSWIVGGRSTQVRNPERGAADRTWHSFGTR